MPTTTVDHINGCLCVKYSDVQWLTPERVSLWWPVRKCPREEVEYLIGADAIGAGGGYSARQGNKSGAHWVSLYLINGGQTQAIHTETVPVPCPRVRRGIETRWYQGRWEKRLAAGWVPA